MNPTPSKGGRHLRIYYVSQVSVKPPSVVLFVNDETLSMQSYTRYLEGKIRETFSFEGTPIRILYRNKEKKDSPINPEAKRTFSAIQKTAGLSGCFCYPKFGSDDHLSVRHS